MVRVNHDKAGVLEEGSGREHGIIGLHDVGRVPVVVGVQKVVDQQRLSIELKPQSLKKQGHHA